MSVQGWRRARLTGSHCRETCKVFTHVFIKMTISHCEKPLSDFVEVL